MSGKRQNDVDMVATKGDIVKDIIADVISQEIHHETGIACSKRENTEIRVNIIKLEQLVKEYDLNNPEKELPLYETTSKTNNKKIRGLDKLKTYAIIKEDIERRKEIKSELNNRAKRKVKKDS
jgi:hypothetical protein